MEKEAVRKKSNDPVQEHLRQNKDAWNQRVSVFIDDLKQFKKLMNGFASKFNMEKSKIINPIPGDPNSVLSGLAGSFREIAEGGLSIVQEQAEYSKTRKQKKPSENLPKPTASYDYNLITEAGKLSRFLSSLKGPWFGNSPERRKKMYRLQLLKSVARLKKQYETFQAQVISKSPESIVASSQLLDRIIRNINSIQATLQAYVASLPKEERDLLEKELSKEVPEKEDKAPEKKEYSEKEHKEEDKKNKLKKDEVAVKKHVIRQILHEPSEEDQKPISHEEIKPPPPQEENIEQVKKDLQMVVEGLWLDYERNKNAFTEIDSKLALTFNLNKTVFNNLLKNTITSLPAIKRAVNDIAALYKQMVIDLSKKLKVDGNSFSEIKVNRENKTAFTAPTMQKTADNILKKWYGKLRHKLWSDETTASRLDMYELSSECLDLLEPVLNSLEDDFEVKEMLDFVKALREKNQTMSVLLSPLKDKTKEHRFSNPLFDILLDPSIMDYDVSIPKDQREEFKKRLQKDRQNEWQRLYRKNM